VVTVVDYDAGNLRSVETALRHIGSPFVVTADPEVLGGAGRIIVPGVGEARAAMARLDSRGLSGALRDRVAAGVPVLGICLGSQIVLDRSAENEATCLGLIPGEALAFSPGMGLKIPHMGWNTISVTADHPLLLGIDEDSSFYFVHSYYPAPAVPAHCLATCEYGERFCAVLGRDNLVATQFHPEKSGSPGLRMLQNFIDWNP
jgi:imidazole glycerol-phosphate synthase subunit HisH